jgi:predicted anti-sigma-YlaC factor YlaD
VAVLNCRQVVELAAEQLRGGLDPVERVGFETHLERCDSCAAYLDQLETTIRVAGRLAPGVIPDATMGSLVAAFRSWPRGTPPA